MKNEIKIEREYSCILPVNNGEKHWRKQVEASGSQVC